MDIKLVNAAIVDVKIDRHQVTNPIGFTGKNVKVGVYNAFAPIVYLGALETVAENTNLSLMGIAAEPYAVAKAVGMEQGQDFSAVFIDIGGGTTDIAVVRGGGLEGTRVFAIGGRAFTKRLAKDFGVSFEKAEQLKISYSEGSLDDKRKEKVGKILEEDIKIWNSGVKMVLKEFSDNQILPSKILLSGGGSLLPEVKNSLIEKDWESGLAFAKKPEVSFIKPIDVKKVVDETKTLDDPSEIGRASCRERV